MGYKCGTIGLRSAHRQPMVGAVEGSIMWTRFMDMHSGGGLKESPYQYIYIEAPEAEATVIFYNRFGHSPSRVTCTCCGDGYSINEGQSLKQLSGFDRNCRSLETPRVDGRYLEPNDPWFKEHTYLEPHEHAEAARRGYKLSSFRSRASDSYQTLDEYIKRPDVLVIRADEIKPEWRVGEVPEQGFVWRD